MVTLHPSAAERLLLFLLLAACAIPISAQQSQQLVFAGLRSVAAQGQFNAVKSDASGNLYLLLDQKDGVRLLKTDSSASTILAQALLGAQGDSGLALALDPSGSVYVTGTSTSNSLTGTANTPFPNRTDTSTNSFIARFDPNLNPIWVTFTGASRIAANAIAATADAVFVTGLIFSNTLPVTGTAIQQAPAYLSNTNGFVERFSSDGSALVYATYLTGQAGDTSPTSIAADASDNAYLAGTTSSPGYPTIAAVIPAMLGNPSGFLTKLTPGGDGITFSTYIPGAGVTSLALDSTGTTLLLSGSISLGQFPVDTVSTPVIPTTYQTLVRMPLDGSTVLSSTLLAPGTQSFVSTSASGNIWIDGTLTAPLFPTQPLATIGQGFAIGLDANNTIAQTARFGGLPNGNPTFASIPLNLTSIAVDPTGEPILAGTVQPGASTSLLATQTYDLPLRNNSTQVLPSTIRNATLTPSACDGSLCAGSAAYLAKLSPTAAPALTFSADDLPFVTLRNLGSTVATNLQLTSTNLTISTNCPTTLYAGGECSILLTGSTTGTLTASADNTSPQSISLLPPPATLNTIVFSPKELDFGIQTSTSPAATKTITISNLGTAPQTFSSALDFTAKSPPTTFTLQFTDCTAAGPANTYLLAPAAACHIVLALNPSSISGSDAFEQANWSIGARDILLTGFQQAAFLSVSASEIDFGTQYVSSVTLPRYLYLSNSATATISHAAVASDPTSPFTITDHCPASLAPATVCQLKLTYRAPHAPSSDSTTLALDQGLTVLVAGRTLPQPGVTGASVNPNLSVSPGAITFANSVPVTATSGSTQTVTVANMGSSPFPLTLALTGDFTDTTNCAATLPGNASCSVLLTFAPSQPGTRTGLLAVTAGSGTTPAYVSLSGTATAILPSNNGALDQGADIVGQPAFQWIKITQPFRSLTLNATGPYTVVLVEDIGYGHGQPPSSSFLTSGTGTCLNCYLGIQFLPTATGPQPGTLTFTSSTSGAAYSLTLTGTGLPLTGLILTPATQDFGAVPTHSTSAPSLFTLTNLSSPSVSVTPATTGDFTLTPTPTGGTTCGGPLAYGSSCFLQIAFSPATAGPRTGTLTITAGSQTASATLTGFASPDPGVSLNPTALSFNNIPGSTATQQTITLTNTSASSIQVGTPTTATPNFQPASTCGTLAPAASCILTITFNPGPATLTDTLQLPITQSIGGATPTLATYTISLTGAYTTANAGLQILPLQTQFGPAPTGTLSQPHQVTLNNLTSKPVALSVAIPRQFVLSGAPCTVIAANCSCTVTLNFLPLTNGDIPGSLIATATPTDGSAAFQGIGYVEGYGLATGSLAVTGSILPGGLLNFGQVVSGQTATQTLTLTNKALTPLTIRRLTSQPPFLATSTCGAALAQSQSCTATIAYSPVNQVASNTSSPANSTNTGTLTIESDASFSPYAVLLSGQVSPITVASPANTAPLVAYSLSQQSLTFPATTVGNVSTPQSVTLTNTGTAPIQVNSAQATPDFTVTNPCAALLPAATCTLTVTSTPQTSGQHVAALQIASTASTALDFVSLLGSAAGSNLTFSPTSLDFGSIIVGASTTLPIQLTNSGATPINIASVASTGDYASASACPAALAASATCTVTVTFTPTTTGTRAGTLSVTSDVSTLPLTVALTGIGIQSQLSIKPSALAFGPIVVGNPANLALTLTNLGSAPITGLTLAITGDYAVTIPCPQTTLAPSATCTTQITFAPAALGPRPGTLTISSSDTSSPLAIPITGTGIAPTVPPVTGTFTLTVDGASASSETVKSGSPATYSLTLTPTSGCTGTVALTCTPVIAAQFASCSLLPSTIVLNGTAQLSVATINTITSGAASNHPPRPFAPANAPLHCLLAPTLFLLRRARRKLPLLVILAALISFSACSSSSIPAVPAVTTDVRTTPPGTYQYQVTASSTTGPPITQTVTLNLIVQ